MSRRCLQPLTVLPPAAERLNCRGGSWPHSNWSRLVGAHADFRPISGHSRACATPVPQASVLDVRAVHRAGIHGEAAVDTADAGVGRWWRLAGLEPNPACRIPRMVVCFAQDKSATPASSNSRIRYSLRSDSTCAKTERIGRPPRAEPGPLFDRDSCPQSPARLAPRETQNPRADFRLAPPGLRGRRA